MYQIIATTENDELISVNNFDDKEKALIYIRDNIDGKLKFTLRSCNRSFHRMQELYEKCKGGF